MRTRLAILRAAAEVFDEVGYEAAAISEILKRSGMTKGALYFHFASKKELAQQILTEQVDAVPPVMPQELVLQEGVDEALLLAFMLHQGDPVVRGSVRLTVDEGAPQDGLDRRVPLSGWVDHNAELLGRAKRAGELLPDVEVVDAARMFIGGFIGTQLMSKHLTGYEDLMDRAADITKHLITSIAVPSVLVRLDFAAKRGARVYEEAMKLRHDAE
ncbi:ScbR family autoregulator-binding transcription factor [Streptomyces luteolus]